MSDYIKVKVQVYIKSEDSSSDFTFYPLVTACMDLFIRVPFQLNGEHSVLQPFQRNEFVVHISIYLHFHRNNVSTLRGEKHDISLKILHQAGFESARQSAKLAKRHALAIASRPTLHNIKNREQISNFCVPGVSAGHHDEASTMYRCGNYVSGVNASPPVHYNKVLPRSVIPNKC